MKIFSVSTRAIAGPESADVFICANSMRPSFSCEERGVMDNFLLSFFSILFVASAIEQL